MKKWGTTSYIFTDNVIISVGGFQYRPKIYLIFLYKENLLF